MAVQSNLEQTAIAARDLLFYALQALGGSHSITDMVQMISRGFPAGKVIRLAAEYEIPEALLRKTFHISPSAFQRRKRSGRFTADKSGRFVRLAGLCGMAADVLGCKRDASEWMSAPNRSLCGDSNSKASKVHAHFGRPHWLRGGAQSPKFSRTIKCQFAAADLLHVECTANIRT